MKMLKFIWVLLILGSGGCTLPPEIIPEIKPTPVVTNTVVTPPVVTNTVAWPDLTPEKQDWDL